jgi:hypothetical protein
VRVKSLADVLMCTNLNHRLDGGRRSPGEPKHRPTRRPVLLTDSVVPKSPTAMPQPVDARSSEWPDEREPLGSALAEA